MLEAAVGGIARAGSVPAVVLFAALWGTYGPQTRGDRCRLDQALYRANKALARLRFPRRLCVEGGSIRLA